MLNFLKRLLPHFWVRPLEIVDSGPMPTLLDLVDEEEMADIAKLYRELSDDPEWEDSDPENESDLLDDDEDQLVQSTVTGAVKVFAIVGRVTYMKSDYLVCLRQVDMNAHDADEVPEDQLTPTFIFQVIPGVGGEDFILYPVEDGPLHDAIYDVFSELDY